MPKRICGLYLTAVAVLVAAHTIVAPLYHVPEPGQPYSSFWAIVISLMVLAIVLGVLFGYLGKQYAAG